MMGLPAYNFSSLLLLHIFRGQEEWALAAACLLLSLSHKMAASMRLSHTISLYVDMAALPLPLSSVADPAPLDLNHLTGSGY